MLNILIVDDSIMLREKLRDILADLGHNIVGTAKDGLEAVALTKELKPDLITMDIIMPNMDGIEAIKKIKEYDKKVPIVVLSTDTKQENILISFKEGAVGYIIKPFAIEQIKKEIDNIFPEYCAKKGETDLDDEKGGVAMGEVMLDVIRLKTKAFFTESIDADCKNVEIVQNSSNKLTLNDYATTIYVHGKLNFTVMMSFEESLIKKIASIFLNGEEVKENEKMIIYTSVAKETINTVVGLSLAFFTDDGSGLNITPPARVDDRKIKKFDDITKFSEDLMTKFGKLSISVINYNIKSI